MTVLTVFIILVSIWFAGTATMIAKATGMFDADKL